MLITATRRAASQRAPRLLLRGNFASRLLSSAPAAAGSQAAAGALEVLQRPAESGSAYEAYSGRGGGWAVAKSEEAFNPVAPFLPAGVPSTVTEGYGQYAALQFLAYTFSSACGVLSTRVLLTAVGVGDGAAAPLAAAANWAIKDGLGMLGGVAFAATWSTSLDARPRQWRLRSSAALDAASLVELAALPAFPQYFVPIAGLANVAKNVSYLAASASRAAIHQSLTGQEKRAKLPTSNRSYLGRVPLVLADFPTSDHLLERSRSASVFLWNARARNTLSR